MSGSDGIVHLWDLSEDEVYLNFSIKFKKKLFDLAIKKSGSTKNLAEILSVQTCQISYYKENKWYMPLRILKKLSKYLISHSYKDFSLSNIENKITYIKGKGTATPIKNPNFPINFNSVDGGIVISAALHDGCISSGCSFYYTNNNTDLKKRVYESVKNLIGEFELDIRKNILKFPKIVCLILLSVGLKNGSKVMTNARFPKFLLETKDEKTISEILNQAISDDGYFGTKSLCIAISVCSQIAEVPQILLDDRSFFQKLKIDVKGPYFWKSYITNRYKRKMNKYYILISGQKNLLRLREKIQISHKRKNKRLDLELIYEREQFPYGTSMYEVLKACLILKRKKEKITAKNVSNLIKRHERTARDIIHNVVDDGFLKEIAAYRPWYSAIYDFTKNGLKYLENKRKSK